MQTFSSFKLLQESKQALKKNKRKVFFISCFAWVNAACLTRKSDLFLKALLQFVVSVAKLERHLLSIANAHIVTPKGKRVISQLGAPGERRTHRMTTTLQTVVKEKLILYRQKEKR